MSEKRVVNIDKKIFDIIKKYCNENALNVPKWLEKISIDHISLSTQNIIENDYKSSPALIEFEDAAKKRVGTKEFEKYIEYTNKRIRGEI